jgi:hypothetical protein
VSDKREVRLDTQLQERLLERMREEQDAAVRTRSLRNWLLVPIAIALLIAGSILSFSDNMLVGFFANTIAVGIATVLWRMNRERIRDWIGR